MIKNIRRKVANAISPEKSHDYPVIELKWATAQSENRRSLERAHKGFEQVFGRPAINDAEAWKWDREQFNVSLKNLGLDPVSTDFIPEHFYEKENTPDSENQG